VITNQIKKMMKDAAVVMMMVSGLNTSAILIISSEVEVVLTA
jgi:hypothetical protein